MRKMAFQEANNLLKTKDFDDDGSSECLGASIKDITLYKSDSLMTGDYPVPEAFLKRCNQEEADGFFGFFQNVLPLVLFQVFPLRL